MKCAIIMACALVQASRKKKVAFFIWYVIITPHLKRSTDCSHYECTSEPHSPHKGMRFFRALKTASVLPVWASDGTGHYQKQVPWDRSTKGVQKQWLKEQ